MVVRPLCIVACAWWAMCAASTASAFCRTHTKDPSASSCPELCTRSGEPLFWATPNLTYSFNRRGFPGLSPPALRDIFRVSFETWENVRCDGESVGLDIQAESATTSLEVGPMEAEPNDNVIVHFDAEAWFDEDLPSKAFAITAVWYDVDTGEIRGADIMFNGGMDPFGECSPQGCTAFDPHTDLRNVATHEIGHFLGLSHSDVPDSTMWCDAEPQEIGKRSLSPDDIAGLCAIYPPGSAFRGYTDNDGACRAAAAPRASWAALGMVLFAALGLLFRRRLG